jgi:hypothetical protein
VGERLGVGLGRQSMAAGLETVAKLAEVLDDPLWMTVISPVQS